VISKTFIELRFIHLKPCFRLGRQFQRNDQPYNSLHVLSEIRQKTKKPCSAEQDSSPTLPAPIHLFTLSFRNFSRRRGGRSLSPRPAVVGSTITPIRPRNASAWFTSCSTWFCVTETVKRTRPSPCFVSQLNEQENRPCVHTLTIYNSVRVASRKRRGAV